MHEPRASALSYRDRYCIVRVHHMNKILEKCDINVLLLVIGAGVTVYCVARIFCRARRNILGYFVATQDIWSLYTIGERV